MGLINLADLTRAEALIARAGLPVEAPALGVGKYLDYMGVDKKVEGGKIRFVLLKNIGEAFVTGDVPEADLQQTLK
jgi:3-dehydroquinate synthase